ncbi:MAG: hypothetical protein K8R37_07195 [Bacteroidales bacterium]|nr:hypothetical protein [Bacteroidales bacterium]
MDTIAANNKYNIELSFNEILKLIKSLSIDDKILLEQELERETLILRSERLSERIKESKITMDEIVNEVKAVRRSRYEK